MSRDQSWFVQVPVAQAPVRDRDACCGNEGARDAGALRTLDAMAQTLAPLVGADHYQGTLN